MEGMDSKVWYLRGQLLFLHLFAPRGFTLISPFQEPFQTFPDHRLAVIPPTCLIYVLLWLLFHHHL